MSRFVVSPVDRIECGFQVGSGHTGMRVDAVLAGMVRRTATDDTAPTGKSYGSALAVYWLVTVIGCGLCARGVPLVGGDFGQGSVDDLYVVGEWSTWYS